LPGKIISSKKGRCLINAPAFAEQLKFLAARPYVVSEIEMVGRSTNNGNSFYCGLHQIMAKSAIFFVPLVYVFAKKPTK
jgi:hypothetical protein